jgi:hypothetical protein
MDHANKQAELLLSSDQSSARHAWVEGALERDVA